MKSALRRVRGEGNPKCDDSTDKFRDWDSDRGLSKKLPKTCGYHKSIPKANGARRTWFGETSRQSQAKPVKQQHTGISPNHVPEAVSHWAW